MVTASQLLCGNLIHIWQARSCKLVLVAFGHPGDHPERSGPSCIPANSSGAILCLPHCCKRWLRFFVPMLLQLYCAQKVEAEKHEPVASKTLGLHRSFAVHLHWVRICCQVWTPSASHCYPSGHTAFPYNFPHPFPRACENKKAHVWQLLHTEALGVIMESSDGNHLPHGSVPLAWPSVPPSSVTDSASWAENDWQFLRAVFSQNQSFEDKGQRESTLVSWRNTLTALPPLCHFTDSRAIATALNMDSSIQGKTRLPSNPLLFTPVSCAECIDSISYFLNHKTRCAPSRLIYGDWIHAIWKCRIKIKNPKKAEICWCLELSVS